MGLASPLVVLPAEFDVVREIPNWFSSGRCIPIPASGIPATLDVAVVPPKYRIVVDLYTAVVTDHCSYFFLRISLAIVRMTSSIVTPLLSS